MDQEESISSILVEAKQLRQASKTSQALSLIRQGIAKHPENIPLLLQAFDLARSNRDPKYALKLAARLAELDPSNPDNHFRHGRALAYLRNDDAAHTAFQVALEASFSKSITEIGKIVERRIAPIVGNIASTRFTPNTGITNVGSFLHTVGEKTYFTKITLASQAARREASFYRELRATSETLKATTPGYIADFEIHDLCFLTIENVRENSSGPNLTLTIQGALALGAVSASEIPATMLPKRAPKLTSHPMSVQGFFGEIHQMKANISLFRQFRIILTDLRYPPNVHLLFAQLEPVFTGTSLHTLILPDKHYSLMHYDFKPDNVLSESESQNQFRIIDWADYSVGLRYVDLARSFSFSKTSWYEFVHHPLMRTEILKQISAPERIYLYLAFLMQTTLQQGPRRVNRITKDTLIPCLIAITNEVEDVLQADPTGSSIPLEVLQALKDYVSQMALAVFPILADLDSVSMLKSQIHTLDQRLAHVALSANTQSSREEETANLYRHTIEEKLAKQGRQIISLQAQTQELQQIVFAEGVSSPSTLAHQKVSRDTRFRRALKRLFRK